MNTANDKLKRALAPMLNVGCGRRFHSDWTNVDLVPMDDSVVACDTSKGLPFKDGQFAVVYHSHVLEHLGPEQGHALVEECFRVLRPGGVLRVVVPDLEQIAKLYLQKHELAWQANQHAADYQWMKLELLDQLVRGRSGGQMGRYITGGEVVNLDFVAQRLGHEMVLCDPDSLTGNISKTTRWQRLKNWTTEQRHRMARRFVRWLMGRDAVTAFDEGLFRSQGEVHRWMYDRFSLRQLFEEVGFEQFQVKAAETSQIDDFASFELDSCAGETRKPDSIFVEAIKSAEAVGVQSTSSKFAA